MSENKSFQDYYPDDFAVCYGCGSLNAHGLHVKSYWKDDESICEFSPKPYHTAMPGFVYGGLIASIIDCHSTGTAMAAKYRSLGKPIGSPPPLRFVTGSLHVDYLKPTPIDEILVLHGVVEEIKERKVVVITTLYAGDVLCAKGEVVAVQAPDSFFKGAF